MADEFGQWVKGLSLSGDTAASTDGLLPVAALNDDKWVPLLMDITEGWLGVWVENTTIAVSGTFWPTTQPVSGTVTADQGNAGSAAQAWLVKPTDGTYYMPMMDALARPGFQKITDGSEVLLINGDGSINVSVSGAANTVYTVSAGVNCVKATPVMIVTRTPATITEYFKGFSVSGTGLCHWEIQYGPTGSETTIMDIWTTPSHPFEFIDIPDSIAVTTAQTILIKATNSEKAVAPASDFTGYATLIRGA